MKAVQFRVSIPRYVFGLIAERFTPAAYLGRFSCLQYREDVPQLRPLGPDWVTIRTRLGGICGSDLNIIRLRESPSLSPFGSKIFTLGHEQVGNIVATGKNVAGFQIGQRVVVDPVLPCPVRGIDPLCPACQAGQWSRCRNFAEGKLSPGVILGSCWDTGGSWSPYFLAHKFQLFAVPDNVSDENALLIEPFTTALHPVMRCFPQDSDTVLVIGAGVMGICTVAALRCLDSRAHIIVLAKYPFQGDLAKHYGANEVILLGQSNYYQVVAKATEGRLYQPILGKQTMIGGVDVIYDCVGNNRSLDDALRFAKAGGRLMIIGLVGQMKLDLTPLWFQELTVIGSNCGCTLEEHQGEQLRTFEWALRWMCEGKLDLSRLLTHTFPLFDFRKALTVAMNKGKYHAVKVAFKFE